jgi:hypothetical protein
MGAGLGVAGVSDAPQFPHILDLGLNSSCQSGEGKSVNKTGTLILYY